MKFIYAIIFLPLCSITSLASELYEDFSTKCKGGELPNGWAPMSQSARITPTRTDWDAQVLVFGGNRSDDLAGWVRQVPMLNIGEVGTYYFEFSLQHDQVNHYIGISSTLAKAMKDESNLKASVILRNSSSGFGVDLLAALPDGKSSVISANMEPAEGVYYSMWLVLDTVAFTYDVYLKEAGTGAASEDDLVAKGVDFNKIAKRDLQTVAVMSKRSSELKSGAILLKNLAFAKGCQLNRF
ncbi:hypothetical protein [Persicirhabdus sediminis]|uniref:Uncharacterized protein n=1 Tax=Persicirhabdus sediminis TaxID=454144 RepID=A0A8J7MD73_9BACT|nr:hypothetical protein [Persicirhabdus sediminis]MBK1790378.1 hypothetical protein [Persicirhabdus sediminis]